MTVSGAQTGHKTPPPPLFNSFSQPAKTSFNRVGNTSSGSGSGRNVYVSPVIINDSEDDDLDWSLKRSGGRSSNNNSLKSSQSRNINITRSFDSYNNSTVDGSQKTSTNGSNGYDNEDDEEDTNTTSDYTKRLLQFREGKFNVILRFKLFE